MRMHKKLKCIAIYFLEKCQINKNGRICTQTQNVNIATFSKDHPSKCEKQLSRITRKRTKRNVKDVLEGCRNRSAFAYLQIVAWQLWQFRTDRTAGPKGGGAWWWAGPHDNVGWWLVDVGRLRVQKPAPLRPQRVRSLPFYKRYWDTVLPIR